MTTILVILNPNSILMLESERPTPELVRQIEDGNWSFVPWGNLWLPQAMQSFTALDGLLMVYGQIPEQAIAEQVEHVPQLLSPQQERILEGLMEGLTSKEIAARLHLSKRTMDEYTGMIKRKLQARTIAQTVGRAVALGHWKHRRR
jgi:DNA-binding CsgD family transcriptional regulator